MRNPTKTTLTVACTASIVAGCGGNTPNPSSDDVLPDVAGYFTGTMTETGPNAGASMPAFAIGSTQAGHFQVATGLGYRQFDVVAQPSDSNIFDGIAAGYLATSGDSGINTFAANVPAQFSYDGATLNGIFELTNGGTDSFSLTHQAGISAIPANLPSLAGTWREQQSQGYTLNVTLDQSGHANGNDGHCTYSAQIAVADPLANLFSVGETLQCLETRTLTGFAVHVPAQNGVPEQIVMVTANGSIAAARTFVRTGF